MEAFIEKEDGNKTEEEIEPEIDDELDINLEKEKSFWSIIIIPNMIYIPEKCHFCHRKTFKVPE